jgi:hypothetical protein
MDEPRYLKDIDNLIIEMFNTNFFKRIILILLFGSVITLLGNIQSVKLIYGYHIEDRYLDARVKQSCYNFSELAKLYFKAESDFVKSFEFYRKYQYKIDSILALENKEIFRDIDHNKYYDRCVQHEQLWIAKLYLSDLADGKSVSALLDMNIVNFHIMKLGLNLAALVVALLITLTLMNKIKSMSEGIFRISIIIYLIIGGLTITLSTHSVVAASVTQAVTFPTSILLLGFFLYMVLKWIIDGFRFTSK